MADMLETYDSDGSYTINPNRPFVKIFEHKKMIFELLQKARTNDRDFMRDIFRLIIVYLTNGTNNLDRVRKSWSGSAEEKVEFDKMVEVYVIQSVANIYEDYPTLNRISEAFPQISLVLFDQIFTCKPGPVLPLCVSDAELGAEVDRHLKINFFPSLIDANSFGVKAQAGLLLYNLCEAKFIIRLVNTGHIVSAFVTSCRRSSRIMEQRLASRKARRQFTEFVESLPFDSKVLDRVWTCVVGDARIRLTETTALTFFHEKVLNAQPLTLAKWEQLMQEKNASNIQ